MAASAVADSMLTADTEHQRQLQTERRLFVWNHMADLITLCVPQSRWRGRKETETEQQFRTHNPACSAAAELQGDELTVSVDCTLALSWLLKMKWQGRTTTLAKVCSCAQPCSLHESARVPCSHSGVTVGERAKHRQAGWL